MSIIVHCPCGKRYRVKDKAAGRTMRCASCGADCVVPGAGTVGGSMAVREVPLRQRHYEAEVPSTTSVERCPHCQEEVDCTGVSGDVICPYCEKSFHVPEGAATVQPAIVASERRDIPEDHSIGPQSRHKRSREGPGILASSLQGFLAGVAVFVFAWIFCLMNIWPFVFGLHFRDGNMMETPLAKLASSISNFALSGYALICLAAFAGLGLLVGVGGGLNPSSRQE